MSSLRWGRTRRRRLLPVVHLWPLLGDCCWMANVAAGRLFQVHRSLSRLSHIGTRRTRPGCSGGMELMSVRVAAVAALALLICATSGAPRAAAAADETVGRAHSATAMPPLAVKRWHYQLQRVDPR